MQIQNELLTQDTQSKSAMTNIPRKKRNRSKRSMEIRDMSVGSNHRLQQKDLYSSDINLAQINCLKETYQQVALYQNEMARREVQ